ncbi:MAG: DUF1559 domain-containing protein [Planctomycetaceae bacterium]|nr:DUF1559 domain-containing protein [Planctomycetaceae bacterium]
MRISGSFHAGLGDGSVRFVSETTILTCDVPPVPFAEAELRHVRVTRNQ